MPVIRSKTRFDRDEKGLRGGVNVEDEDVVEGKGDKAKL
jgi:hypothetical protein